MGNLHPAIARAVSRLDISPDLAEAYQAVFNKCADWFRPTNSIDANSGREEYSLAQVLHHVGLLDERRTSLWRGGNYVGKRVEFKQAAQIATPSDGGKG